MSAAPGGILERIAAGTLKRVTREKETTPLEALREQVQKRPPSDAFFFENALAGPGISFICEVKRASPSKGIIAGDFPYREIAGDYEKAGAAAISVLTEPEFFMGSDEYLREIAAAVKVPVLRKDFILDAYQIYQARLLGAGAVLLICALLDTPTLAAFIECAADLGLSALVEARTEEEVRSALDAGARIIGVNNRDLNTFQVDLNVSLRLRPLVPPDAIFVSESGISRAEDLRRLADAGVDAVLVGEALMRAPDKAAYLAELSAGGGATRRRNPAAGLTSF
ncbi:MAG: indole-3-glycerol phosphate synthase TrpC [Treponema sp.]|nr:indole-3-glycerol phosphate synthase TrpC [Treponema sp.]